MWRPGAGPDCLTLNVWTPDAGSAGLPVMVWIYGGLWKHGTASMPQYDATVLAASGVVVVTFDYRVGFEGFGHLPGVPDNRGLRDQVGALEWVRDNIAAFGGDSGNVTVFGQSAGAASAVLLTAAPAARGLFRRAIAQSVPTGMRTRAEAEAVTATIAEAAGVPATWDGLSGLPPEALLAVQDTPLRGPQDGATAFGPVIDGDLVTGQPWTALEAGAGRDVDLVCGFTHEEFRGQGAAPRRGSRPGGGRPSGRSRQAGSRRLPPGATRTRRRGAVHRRPVRRARPHADHRVARAHARAGGSTWLYDFTWRGPTLGAAHGIDVPFAFGNATSRFAARFLGSPPPAGLRRTVRPLRTAWKSFASTGDPGWPRFTLEHQTTRLWNLPPSEAAYPLEASRQIWDGASTP